MNNQTINPSQFVLQQRIIHGALCLGVVLFAIISQFTLRNEPLVFEITDSLDYVALIIVPSALFGQWKMRESMLQNIRHDLPLDEKLAKYQTLSIIGFALLEGSALMALVFSFLNNSGISLIAGIIGLIALLAQFPARAKLINDLNLSSEEQLNI